jgi:hypothetical protein
LDEDDEEIIDECKTMSGNLAFTWSPQLEEDNEDRLHYPSQITLCPWFYQFADREKFKVSRAPAMQIRLIPADQYCSNGQT